MRPLGMSSSPDSHSHGVGPDAADHLNPGARCKQLFARSAALASSRLGLLAPATCHRLSTGVCKRATCAYL